MKIYYVVNRGWTPGDTIPREQYFATEDGLNSYFREIKYGFVEELRVTSPITNDILVSILNGEENYIERRSQVGYKYARK